MCCIIKNLCQVPGMELLKPLEFPRWQKCCSYSWASWITHEFFAKGWPLEGSLIAPGWELVTRKTNCAIRGAELWACLTSREGREAVDWVQLDGQWFNPSGLGNETPPKAQWHCLVDEGLGGRWALIHGKRTRKLCIWGPSRSHPMCLFV